MPKPPSAEALAAEKAISILCAEPWTVTAETRDALAFLICDAYAPLRAQLAALEKQVATGERLAEMFRRMDDGPPEDAETYALDAEDAINNALNWGEFRQNVINEARPLLAALDAAKESADG